MKINNNKLKIILKKILQKYIPKEHFLRPKMGFAIPLEKWFDDKKMINLTDELLHSTNWDKLYYKKNEVITSWERYKKSKCFPAIKIWSYLVSAIWINKNT